MSSIQDQIRQLRNDYSSDKLEESQAAHNPVIQFGAWLEDALEAKVPEPHAMILSTCGADHQPSSRTVLLRVFDDRGFCFFTNYESNKGKEIDENPKASILFLWSQIERQVRIEGQIEKVSPQESDDYFHSRPRGNRLGAWASPQSKVMSGREELEELVTLRENEFEGTEIPRPPHWGGYRLIPTMLEFWQGRPSRLHDRLRYLIQEDGTWKMERLAP